MARTTLKADAVKENTLEDKDGNTYVKVEQNNNEDKIRFVTAGNERMIVDAGGFVGINESNPQATLHINGALIISSSINQELLRLQKAEGDFREITFENEGVDIGSIYFNAAEVFFIRQESSTNDLAFRIGTTNAIRIKGATSRIGMYTDAPQSSLDINGSISFKSTWINVANDPGTSYSCTDADHVILINTRPAAQGGIDSSITVTLPSASSKGRVITVKDAGGYSNVNSITIQRKGSDVIDGINTSISMPNIGGWMTFIADGSANWYQIG